MLVNADFDQRVVMDTGAMNWISSPSAGVERKMLDRIGEEVARATSLVRYAPGSVFPAHTHGGGEEFFVIDGVFSDEHGDYGPGAYVRNPPGSRHTPRSEPGCVIFVKLWQMKPDDQATVRLDTDAAPWVDAGSDGVSQRVLARRSYEVVTMLRFEPGAVFEADDLAGGGELLVLDGDLIDEDGLRLQTGGWARRPARDRLRLRSESGAKVYLKTGHLAEPPTAPPQD